jgi:hypothetical protein
MRFVAVVVMMSCFQSIICSMTFYRGVEHVIAGGLKSTHTPVFMDHSDVICVDDSVNKKSIISTGGLVGCLSTILYVKNEYKQLQKVILTHHSNGSKEHVVDLKERIKKLHEIHSQFDYAHCIVIGPKGKNELVEEEQIATFHSQKDQLHKVVKDNLQATILHMTVNTYDIMPLRFTTSAKVEVTLSDDKQSYSSYIIQSNVQSNLHLLDKRTKE